MPQQKGILPLKGTMGNLTFYKSVDGFLVREKGGIDANRIAFDPSFQRTRENGAEFGRAGKAGKLVRDSVRDLLDNASDSRLVSRLTKAMIKVVQSDEIDIRGMRNVENGNIELLQGFDFNIHSSLNTTLFAQYNSTIDRVTGVLTISFDEYIPSVSIKAPSGATHYQINSAGAELDFEAMKYLAIFNPTKQLPLTTAPEAAFDLINNVTPNSTLPLFLFLGLEFFQQVNNVMYPLRNGGFNSLSLIQVLGTQ